MGTRVNGIDLDAGTSVTISTATPQPLGTAAAGSTGEASDAGHVHDRELPDPRDAHDGQVPTTASGAYVLAAGMPDPTGAHDGQVVTTTGGAYVLAGTIPALSTATPAALGTAAAGVSTEASRADHVHALPTIPALSTATPAALGTAAAGVSTEASRADHVHEAPASGIDTSLQAAPDTGWTAAGDGTASITAGVVTLAMAAAQPYARLHRDIPASPLSPSLELTARITRTASPGGDFHWCGVALSSAAWDRGYTLLCQSDGNATVGYNTGGGWTTASATAFPGAATLTSGTLWSRVVIAPSYVAWYLGAGASRPTSWTLMATRAMDTALLSAGSIVTLAALCGRATGSGTATFTVSDIQWRSLLGAPT